MKRAIIGALAGIVAAVGFVTTAADIEAEQPSVVLSDPLKMSAADLASAFPNEFDYLRQQYRFDDVRAANALRLTWAAGSAREWAMSYLPEFAGAWVDYTTSTMFIGVAGGKPAVASATYQLATATKLAGVRPIVVPMRFTYGQLVSAATALQAAVDPSGTGAAQVSISESSGDLTVDGMSARQSTTNPAVTGLLARAGGPSVHFAGTTLTDPTAVSGGWDGRTRLGCTLAFTVVSPTNTRAVLTAGHCADNSVSDSTNTLSVAQSQRSFWPWLGGAADAGYDRQLHTVATGTSTLAHLDVPNVDISGTFLPAQGSVICRYGAASVANGQAKAFCSTVTGYRSDGFIGMATGCITGDSGGPSWVMGKAVGIAAVTTDPTWPVDAASTCWEAPVKDQLNGTGYFVQDITYGYGTDFSAIGLFHPVSMTRVLDTRGTGGISGQTEVRLDSVLNYSDLGAVALSVTVVPHGVAGSAAVYPGDSGFVPGTLSVSYGPTDPASNFVISRVNRYTKRIKIATTQPIDLIVDVIGYFSDTSGTSGAKGGAVRAVPLTASRVYDGRVSGVLAAGSSRDIQVRGLGGVPSSATAVVVNLTVTRPTGAGYLTAHAGGTAASGTSNMNFVGGQTKARLAIVQLDVQGRIGVTAGGASNEYVIVDVQGYMEPSSSATTGRTFATDGGGGRLLDTRAGQPLVPGTPLCVDVYSDRVGAANGLPRDGLLGVWLSVTTADPLGAGYVVVSAKGTNPSTSNINFVAGRTRSNAVFVAVPSATDGTLCFAGFGSTTNLVVDVLAMTMR